MTTHRHSILITGASRGIGRAIALALSRDGWPTICWARSDDALRAMADEAEGPTPIVHRVDMAEPDSIEAGCAALEANGMPLGGVILNAGAGRWRSFEEQSLDDWRRTHAVNVDGHVETLSRLLPGLKRTPGASIIAILSDSALYPFPGRTAYAASKASLRMLLESLRGELRPAGIRIGAIFPSRVDTHFQGSTDRASPGSRPGSLTAAEVAAAVVYMLGRPPGVEIREIRLGSMAASFGPFDARTPS